MSGVWAQENFASERVVDNHIANLRKKIEPDPSQPQYLRNIRMERAAELLRTGRYNVTEAAIEVGYSSLSHFSKAFCETIGCCPVLYPVAKNVILYR